MHSLDAVCESLKTEFDSALTAERQTARATLSNQINELFRRLRAYEGEPQWISLTLDGIGLFSERCALFTVASGGLKLGGCREMELDPELAFGEPLPRAFDNALRSKDSVITLRTNTEVGNVFSSPGVDRALIVPVLNAERVVALVVVIGAGEDAVGGIELVAGVAGLALERRANAERVVGIEPVVAGPVSSTPARASTKPRTLPAWFESSEELRSVHLRAQRFARTRVAEIQLSHSDAARAGREQGNLYLFLKEPIGIAREKYHSQFMQQHRSMPDYFHLELVGVLADGDESRLGDEYPGPLQ